MAWACIRGFSEGRAIIWIPPLIHTMYPSEPDSVGTLAWFRQSGLLHTHPLSPRRLLYDAPEEVKDSTPASYITNCRD